MAISADRPDESKNLAKSAGLGFALLSDPKTEVIRQFGVLHEKGGIDGRDIARPAEFLVVGSDRKIRWTNFTEDLKVRARADEMLNAIDAAR